MLYMCIKYHIQVNMYHVSAQGVDERMINVHYYYYKSARLRRSVINGFYCGGSFFFFSFYIGNKDNC